LGGRCGGPSPAPPTDASAALPIAPCPTPFASPPPPSAPQIRYLPIAPHAVVPPPRIRDINTLQKTSC